MHVTPGATKTILYELKTALDRIHKNSYLNNPKMPKIGQVIPNVKPAFDKTMSITFENAIRAMMENPNDVLMEKALKKYSEIESQFLSRASMSYSGLIGTSYNKNQIIIIVKFYVINFILLLFVFMTLN